MRELIVNADDFGRSPGTDAGIVRAHEEGIVTSASLMVRAESAAAAAEYARSRGALSVGLHLDLGPESAVEEEIARQVELFRSLMGRDPTHVDSHKHIHRKEPVASALAAQAQELGVPLREAGPVAYCGDFYGLGPDGAPALECIEPLWLIGLIERLPAGVTELSCHPGLDPELDSSYREQRPLEVETLCDPRVRAALEREQVMLRSFGAPLD